MRILLVNKFLHEKGGAETYVFRLGEQLVKMGHTVEYFGMSHEGMVVGNSLEKYVDEVDFHKKSISQLIYPLKILYSVQAKHMMTQILISFKPDIVHLNNFNYQLTPSIIYAVKKYEKEFGRTVKILYTAHDYQLLCPNHMMNNPITHKNCEKCKNGSYINCVLGKCIHKSMMRSVLGMIEGKIYHMLGTYKYIDKIICPSYFMENMFKSIPMFQNKTVTIHNFVDKEEIDCSVNKGNYVLYFGRYSPEKGIDTLKEACRMLPHINFVFAGMGDMDYDFSDVHNIKNVGFKSGKDLQKLISEAMFTIIPSEWYENCPFSVLESIMYGTPVLGADIGGIPELIDVGKTGELFESGNVNDLAKKVEMLYNDNNKITIMSKNCLESVFETRKTYTERAIQIYEDLI